MKIKVYDITGKQTKEITLNKDIFGVEVNEDLLKQAVRVYLSNQRQASGKAKTRGEVLYTGKKMYRQKGTGNARHHSRRAPIFVGGAKAHGPREEQNYKLSMSKKMKLAAIKSALSSKAVKKEVIAIDGLTKIKQPKTKEMIKFIEKALKDVKKSSFVVSNEMHNAIKSVRNIANVSQLNVQNLTTYEVLNAGMLVLSVEAVEALEKRLTK